MFAGKSTRPSQDPLSAEQARGLIRRVREKEMEAVAEAARHVAQAEAASDVVLLEFGMVLEGFQIKNPGESYICSNFGKYGGT